MIKAIILDDEQHCRETLRSMLEEFCPEVLVLDAVDNIEDAVIAFNDLKPDLIFLDIELQNENGFSFLEKIGADYAVIFTTAYNEYALKAIKFSALDYILKPINIMELQEAVRKFHRNQRKIETSQLKIISQQIKKTDNIEQMLALPTSEEIVFVKISNIIRCEASNNYTVFFLKEDKKILVSKTIKEYEQILCDHSFIRVHQSHIINVNYIHKFLKNDAYIVMNDDSKIPVSRRNKDKFLNFMSSGI